ncbi:hypothetical protein PIB30_025256 [Stylosanthes scabra]|uniref:Uncharacterized protein n=1 Tax=Stylosanthes scabra TaxID=79078 RepID=A0ABU6TAQ0_9FABA|nr:hypothetical protein [Stylosanthes scabra]
MHTHQPPTPPPPSPPSSDDEPSVETYDPAAELVGDPDEPYVAEHVPIGAPEAYYLDALYGSEHESASTHSAPSSHHSSGNSSSSVSLGYGSASSGSASDGASDDDLTHCPRKRGSAMETNDLGKEKSFTDDKNMNNVDIRAVGGVVPKREKKRVKRAGFERDMRAR